MQSCTYTKIILIVILIILLQQVVTNNKSKYTEGMVNIPKLENVAWTRHHKCNNKIPNAYNNTFKNKTMIKTDRLDPDWNFYLPCGYTHSSREVNRATELINSVPDTHNKRLFIIDNADELTSKHNIWKNLVHTYGRSGASKIMPTTYVLRDLLDMNMFKKEYVSGNLYILKKNIQRQKGLKITNNKEFILNAKNHKYVIAQKLLQNPYLIGGRKINMRFYLLIVCKNREVDAYVHKEGFMYYTKNLFKKNCLEDGPNITTGYIDRSVYDVNPLTHGDFRMYLDKTHGLNTSRIVFNRVYKMLSDTTVAVKNTVCTSKDAKFNNSIKFQLFGADIAIDDELIPQLIEVNKGPDIGAKDPRDRGIKNRVIGDIFKILSGETGGHDFIKILE